MPQKLGTIRLGHVTRRHLLQVRGDHAGRQLAGPRLLQKLLLLLLVHFHALLLLHLLLKLVPELLLYLHLRHRGLLLLLLLLLQLLVPMLLLLLHLVLLLPNKLLQELLRPHVLRLVDGHWPRLENLLVLHLPRAAGGAGKRPLKRLRRRDAAAGLAKQIHHLLRLLWLGVHLRLLQCLRGRLLEQFGCRWGRSVAQALAVQLGQNLLERHLVIV
jgi:hypothetical protein